jgi:hypothetical protein
MAYGWGPIDYELWKISFAFMIFLHLSLFSLTYVFIRTRLSNKLLSSLIPIVMLFLIRIPPDYLPLLVAFLAMYIGMKLKRRGLLMFSVIILSIASLEKFLSMISSIGILLFFGFLTIIRRRRESFKELIFMPCAYLTLLCLLWALSGQKLDNIFPFLELSEEISRGYSSAMATKGFDNAALWGLNVNIGRLLPYFAIFGFVALGITLFIFREHEEVWEFIILGLPLFFLSFKHGFVRYDGHAIIYLSVYPLLLSFLLALTLRDLKLKKPRGKRLASCIMLIFCMIFPISVLYLNTYWNRPYAESMLRNNIVEKRTAYVIASKMLLDRNLHESILEDSKLRIQKFYKFDAKVLRAIGNQSVDIIPWDIALCWAYGMNWHPRPVFQSYSAYTQKLDLVNALHFATDDSPSFVIYSYKSIDGRYPLFDEPETFRNILCRYEYFDQSGEFIVLRRREGVDPVLIDEVGSLRGALGEPIPVPDYEEGLIFGRVHLDYSPMGELKKLFWRPSSLYIQFEFKDGTRSQRFRFIPEVAGNGLLLSQYVGSTCDLSLIFKGCIWSDIKSFIIFPENPLDYSDSITVDFFGIPMRGPRIVKLKSPEMVALPKQPLIAGIGTINGESRNVLFEHPFSDRKSLIRFSNISIPEGAILKFGIALDPSTWDPKKGDGVLFEVYVKKGDIERIVFSKYIDPKHNVSERRWNDFEVDLSDYRGSHVTLTLATSPGPRGDANWDWAWWGEPMIVMNAERNIKIKGPSRAEGP